MQDDWKAIKNELLMAKGKVTHILGSMPAPQTVVEVKKEEEKKVVAVPEEKKKF